MQHEQHEIREVAPDTFVDETGHQLTKKEVRQIVTPHAFVVSEDLIGQPLAKPVRRGLAMGIDGIIISGLASASLIFVLPTMLYLCWNRYKAQRHNHLLLMVLATITMMATLNLAPELVREPQNSEATATVLDPASVASLLRLSQQVATDQCDDECAEQAVRELSADLQQAGASRQQQQKLLDELLSETKVGETKKSELLSQYVKEVPAQPAVSATETDSWLEKLKQSDYSLLKWIRGLLADFGLGFGWAMAYFTFYTSWNNGQTVGKMLTRTRVVQLDNQPITLWASFSRQGGYGAGFATGLVGFAQILWDPNRQAIQDKVASTVVVQLS